MKPIKLPLVPRSFFKLSVGALLFAGAAWGPLANGQTDPGPVDLSNREASRVWYNQWWPKTYGAPMGFTGNLAVGLASDTSAAWKNQSLIRLNILRRMAGCQPVTMNPSFNASAQAAAALLQINDPDGQSGVVHAPPSTWKFWSQAAFDGCQNSALSFGENGSGGVFGLIYDGGVENFGVGHRNALLATNMAQVGFGDAPDLIRGSQTGNTAIWLGTRTTDRNYADDLVRWPAKGYVPHWTIPGRWSVSLPPLGADRSYVGLPYFISTTVSSSNGFYGATVSVTRNGVPMKVYFINGSGINFTLDGTSEGSTVLTDYYKGDPIDIQDGLDHWPNEDSDMVYHVTIRGAATFIPNPNYNPQDLNSSKHLPSAIPYKGTGVIEYDVIGYNPSVGPTSVVPKITTQPISQNAASGATVEFSVASPNAAAYQWFKNGVAMPEQNGALLVLPNVQATDAATYHVLLTATGGSVTSQTASLGLVNANTLKLVNISTRSAVGTGGNIQIGGFVIGGTQPKQVLIRASGPALTQFGLTGVLADPVLTLFSGSTQINQNDDWSSFAADADRIEATATRVGGFSWTRGSKDAALLVTLAPGNYTAQISGKSATTGTALIEVYDADLTATPQKLINISTLSPVTANEPQIAGFVIMGGAKKVLIRASGPALTPLGVSGALVDPMLTLFSGQTQIQQNDDWGVDKVVTFRYTEGLFNGLLAKTSLQGFADIEDAARKVGAFPWLRVNSAVLTGQTPTYYDASRLGDGTKDAAILTTLQPGAYTAIVNGKAGASGVALIEVYEVP